MMGAAALGIVKRVFIGTWRNVARDLSDAEECIFDSNLPPFMSDQEEDGSGAAGGRFGEIMPVKE